jgi:Spy/CpxP family protein refolding chaperone
MFQRKLLISGLVIALAGTAALAQGVHKGAGARPGGRGQDFVERLQRRLNLSQTQVDGIRALLETRQKEMEGLRPELRQKRQTLRQSLQQSNPNPNDVGNATLALKDTRQKAREINQQFIAGVKGLLTPEQLQQLPKRLR